MPEHSPYRDGSPAPSPSSGPTSLYAKTMAFLACHTDGLLWVVGQALVWSGVLVGALYGTWVPGVFTTGLPFATALWMLLEPATGDRQTVGLLLFMLFCIFALTTAAIVPALT